MLRATTVFYNVSNMDRAVDFYTKTLGFPLKVRFGNNWAEVDAGSITIGLHPVEESDSVQPNGGATVSFQVPNLDEVVATLKQKGAKVGEIRNPPRGRFVMANDPDGNWLHFIEFNEKWKKETGYPGAPA